MTTLFVGLFGCCLQKNCQPGKIQSGIKNQQVDANPVSPIFPCWESPPTKDHLFRKSCDQTKISKPTEHLFWGVVETELPNPCVLRRVGGEQNNQKNIFLHSLFLFYFITLQVFILMFVSIEFTLFDIDLDGQVWQRRRKMSWDAGTSCGLMYRLWRELSLGWHKFDVSPQRNPKYQNLCSALT